MFRLHSGRTCRRTATRSYGTVAELHALPGRHFAPRAAGSAPPSEAPVTHDRKLTGGPAVRSLREPEDPLRPPEASVAYAPRGIRISPDTIGTPAVSDMIAKGGLDRAEAEANQLINRLGTAEEITQAVPWLRSPGAGFVIGVALPVDGGYIAR
ncbi:SDR family oxidoreductase [Streptomyces sp. NBC_00316]|uniref:SDR family oxidoreductase n=1 Tax=Streptomyces sp. NBC_00316 TaxID=2975710 RepID=UPI002E297CF4|nr:SDR family oxidoreductase [Streptomyces sp. NBC_00316]